MRTSLYVHALLTGMSIVFSACSTTKFVPDGEYLLNTVKLKIEADDKPEINKGQLNSYIRQTPNSRLFSLVRTSLATYSLSGRDSTRWLNRMLRSMGEAPVIYDSVLVERSCADLCQELRNEGFMASSVRYEVERNKKKANVTYFLRPGPAYHIGSLHYDIRDSVIASFLTARGDSTERLLHVGMQFDLSQLDAERKRLTSLLNDQGYYKFHKEYITYLADTLAGERTIDITLRLNLYPQKDRNDTLHSKYSIRHISYSNSDANASRLHLRRGVLRECTHIEENKPYSGTKMQQTYNHFGKLQAVKYTNISLRQVPDTTLLDCDITIQTNKPSTFSFQPEGTNTAGDLGAAVSISYQNRNLFRGSELLSIELRGAFEAIKGLEGYANQNFMEYSAEARLTFPRFLIPFLSHEVRRESNASSELSLMFDMQNRPEFHRRVLSAAWRYKWNFPHRHERFHIDMLDLNYVFMPWISDTFRKEYLESENSRNAILRYNYENLFITKGGFGYSYSNRSTAVKFNIETAGNLLQLGSVLFHAGKDENGHHRLFNIAFAQYAKGDVDLTHSFAIDRNNQIVLHLGAGIAYPYGNSTVLPFEKRYFSGGANSVRGWSVRSLGPGKYKEHDGRINFINQTGDVKLDLNAEYRTHLFWKLGGALFVDAGNIWTLRDYAEQPGGQFRFNTFLSQIAVSYGLGLRFNFDYFILRFDAGMKAINPAYEEEDEEHYPIIHPRFKRDFAFHFAVGLPF
jgi:outer membrane protein assembly factor BamA